MEPAQGGNHSAPHDPASTRRCLSSRYVKPEFRNRSPDHHSSSGVFFSPVSSPRRASSCVCKAAISMPTRETAREATGKTTQGHRFLASDFLSQSGPAELVLVILKACESTKDVLALTATCRHLYHVGRCYAVERLASSGSLRGIPCFREALTAVRIFFILSHGSKAR